MACDGATLLRGLAWRPTCTSTIDGRSRTAQRNPNQPFGAIAPVAKGRRQPPPRWSYAADRCDCSRCLWIYEAAVRSLVRDRPAEIDFDINEFPIVNR
jgi:hypothetical protein